VKIRDNQNNIKLMWDKNSVIIGENWPGIGMGERALGNKKREA
jgi:hypothetical protein